MGGEADLVGKRLARGCRCFGAWLGEELIGYGWLSAVPEWIGEIEVEITPGEGEVYVWNCVTLAPHRRKGAFRALVASIVAQAGNEGLARLWIASAANPAENAVVHAGFVPVVRFDTASRLGLRWLTILPVEGVDPGLLEAARVAMVITPRSSVRRSRSRRH